MDKATVRLYEEERRKWEEAHPLPAAPSTDKSEQLLSVEPSATPDGSQSSASREDGAGGWEGIQAAAQRRAARESSASPEPRCGHVEHFFEDGERRGAFEVQFHGFTQQQDEPCPPSADEGMKGSSRHSDGAAPSDEREDEAPYLEFWSQRLRDLGYLVHKPDLSSPAIPDDRAVLEGRVWALLIEQIAAMVEKRAQQAWRVVKDCTENQRTAETRYIRDLNAGHEDQWTAVAEELDSLAAAVRSFATPGDDR